MIWVPLPELPSRDEMTRIRRGYVKRPPNMVIEIDDCTTTLLFPFVTNQLGFDTGLVITNASEESGSCTITYSGADAPDDLDDTEAVCSRVGQWVLFCQRYCPWNSRAI